MEVSLEFILVNIRKKRGKVKLDLSDFDGSGSSLLASTKKALSPLATGNYKKIPLKSLGSKLVTSTTDIKELFLLANMASRQTL